MVPGLQYLFKACCGRQPGTPEEMKLTVGQLNLYLDQLAGDGVNEGKVKTLTQLLQVTTPNQMKWIIQILLRDLKASHQLKRCLTSALVQQADHVGGFRHFAHGSASRAQLSVICHCKMLPLHSGVR